MLQLLLMFKQVLTVLSTPDHSSHHFPRSVSAIDALNLSPHADNTPTPVTPRKAIKAEKRPQI
jgi:hypothetical protein